MKTHEPQYHLNGVIPPLLHSISSTTLPLYQISRKKTGKNDAPCDPILRFILNFTHDMIDGFKTSIVRFNFNP